MSFMDVTKIWTCLIEWILKAYLFNILWKNMNILRIYSNMLKDFLNSQTDESLVVANILGSLYTSDQEPG